MRAFVQMRRAIHANTGIIQRLESIEKRQVTLETDTNRRFEKVFSAFEGPNTLPKQGLYFDGQIHDAHAFVSDAPIEVRPFTAAHDRFLILDGKTVYHLGASLKDLGKKWFGFSRFDKEALTLLQKLP